MEKIKNYIEQLYTLKQGLQIFVVGYGLIGLVYLIYKIYKTYKDRLTAHIEAEVYERKH